MSNIAVAKRGAAPRNKGGLSRAIESVRGAKYRDVKLFYKKDTKLCPIFEDAEYDEDQTVYTDSDAVVYFPKYNTEYVVKHIIQRLDYDDGWNFFGLRKKRIDIEEYLGGARSILSLDKIYVQDRNSVRKGYDTTHHTVEKGSIITKSGYSEAYIGLAAAELYRTRKCFHILDTLASAFCDTKTEHHHEWGTYILMQKVDGSARTYQTCMRKQSDEYLIQTLVAIAGIQSIGVVHADMHLGNLFMQKTKNDQVWGAVGDALRFVYKIGTKVITTSYTPLVVRVGDWGMSTLHQRNKTIISYEALTSEWVPFWWMPTYDPLYVLYQYITLIRPTALTSRMMAAYVATDTELEMLKSEPSEYLMPQITRRFISLFEREYYRPLLKPQRQLSARDVLTDEWVMGPYMGKVNVRSKDIVLADID